MKIERKKQAFSLGIRIGTLFLIAILVIIVLAYYALSQNFQTLLTNYTIKLAQVMSNQGVHMIETELENGRNEVALLAESFQIPDGTAPVFPPTYTGKNTLRMVYVSETTSISSDGRHLDIRGHPDIQAAFAGETAIYGPYFNEKKEFVICYSAPIRQGDAIIGALRIEKDGYRFCKIIEPIRFANTGESYIINAEGTDIAVSDPNHLSWVTTEYNARRLFNENADEETRSILMLEEKGLRGEAGVGSYYWHNGLCYVIYEPIPSTGWVLLTGLREEELSYMTQSTLFATIVKGPTLKICVTLIFLLTGLIIFWIVASMKKNSEINEKLEVIANHDALTGLLNRRFLETNLARLWTYPVKHPSQAAVFMLDIDNFKQYNDLYGHPKGDDCLRHVASVFKHAFDGYECSVMRYGGEEFIATVFLADRATVIKLGQNICRLVENEKLPNGQDGLVTVSIGICHTESTLDTTLFDCIKKADQALYQAKKSGKNRAVIFDPASISLLAEPDIDQSRQVEQ